MTAIEHSVAGFVPSLAGFQFANRWPPGPLWRWRVALPSPLPITLQLTVGNAGDGLCGGMVLAARDCWEAGVALPADREPPPEGSALRQLLVRRQLDSLDLGRTAIAFYRLALASPTVRAAATVREAWPRIRAEIDAGRPAVVGLLRSASADPRRLVANHQVLAHAYRLDPSAGWLELRVYDPNHPANDAVQLCLGLTADHRGVTIAHEPEGVTLAGLVALPYG